VSGGTPRILQKGKRKGQRTWIDSKDVAECAVTDSDIVAELAQYEKDTGNCSDCWGTGQMWIGWHHIDGHKHETCRKCSGSGKAKQELQVPVQPPSANISGCQL
jgi:DnaJ-class molecular chaperone